MIERLLVANGVKTDLETALFDADHGIRLRAALALARTARADRPSIDGDDVLAWALARNGRCGEALAVSTRALRLGTRDALHLFHRGMIERCLRQRGAACGDFSREALALNPHFSILWAPVARKALSETRLAARRRAASAVARRARRSRAASAHPLGNFTVNHFAAVDLAGNTRLRPLRARPGRDPDVPGGSGGPAARLRGDPRAQSSSSASTACACR